MRVSLIVAVSDNGVIGRDGGLPWHISADLQRFRRLTMGHHLVVGRRTWESIGRPLPGRRVVVVSRGQPRLPPEVHLAGSLDAALDLARLAGDDEAFVAGGAAIYALALPRADRLYLTRIHAEVEGDVRWPASDLTGWLEVGREQGAVDDRSPLPHTFVVYERRARPQAGAAPA
jgi:dihydrofolate reductase